MTSTPARLAVAAALALCCLSGCSTRPETTATLPAFSPTPAVGLGGPGAYVGEALNAVGSPVAVEVRVPADTAAPSGDGAADVAAFLRSAAGELGGPPPEVRFVTVEVDNTGQVDAVPLPANVDVLDDQGRGANFRPAYDVVDEAVEQLTADSPARTAGLRLLRRLEVREGQVRPGKVEVVPYVSSDPLANVARVVLNGSLARKVPG